MAFWFFNSKKKEESDLRDRVMNIARELYPELRLEKLDSSTDSFKANGVQVGLQNLKATFEHSDKSEATLRQLVKGHLSLVLKPEIRAVSFEAAAKKLKPQLMPSEYVAQSPIISFPFGKGISTGLVVDDEAAYYYLQTETAQPWGKSNEELLQLALENLKASKQELPLQASDNPNAKFVGLQTMDGFDAVRILLPSLQTFIGKFLGTPFQFGVPNRDFFICWSLSSSKEFQAFSRKKVQEDFKSRPYPLSPHVFTYKGDGWIVE